MRQGSSRGKTVMVSMAEKELTNAADMSENHFPPGFKD